MTADAADFKSARHFRIKSESSDSNLNQISKLRRSLVYTKFEHFGIVCF